MLSQPSEAKANAEHWLAMLIIGIMHCQISSVPNLGEVATAPGDVKSWLMLRQRQCDLMHNATEWKVQIRQIQPASLPLDFVWFTKCMWLQGTQKLVKPQPTMCRGDVSQCATPWTRPNECLLHHSRWLYSKVRGPTPMMPKCTKQIY